MSTNLWIEILVTVLVQIIYDVLKMAARAVVKALRELIRQYKRSRAYGKHACRPRKRHKCRRR